MRRGEPPPVGVVVPHAQAMTHGAAFDLVDEGRRRRAAPPRARHHVGPLGLAARLIAAVRRHRVGREQHRVPEARPLFGDERGERRVVRPVDATEPPLELAPRQRRTQRRQPPRRAVPHEPVGRDHRAHRHPFDRRRVEIALAAVQIDHITAHRRHQEGRTLVGGVVDQLVDVQIGVLRQAVRRHGQARERLGIGPEARVGHLDDEGRLARPRGKDRERVGGPRRAGCHGLLF